MGRPQCGKSCEANPCTRKEQSCPWLTSHPIFLGSLAKQGQGYVNLCSLAHSIHAAMCLHSGEHDGCMGLNPTCREGVSGVCPRGNRL